MELDEREPDESLVAGLFAVELAAVEHASAGRSREFAAGRECARRALEMLGFTRGPLPVGEDGAPLWPDGVVGSITHKGAYRAAAVAPTAAFSGIGIDAELDEPLPAGVLETIASQAELEMVAALLVERAGVAWDRLLFSAKEAAFKAAHLGLGAGPIGVRAVAIRFGGAGSFTATFHGSDEASANGGWAKEDALILTLATCSRH